MPRNPVSRGFQGMSTRWVALGLGSTCHAGGMALLPVACSSGVPRLTVGHVCVQTHAYSGSPSTALVSVSSVSSKDPARL